MTDKQFRTLVVASAVTGVTMAESMTFSEIHQLMDHVIGYPIFTHEMADPAHHGTIKHRLRAQFPDLPTEQAAGADWKAAAAAAVLKYGETVMVEAGEDPRIEHPLDSLKRLKGDETDVIVIVKGDNNGI